MYAVGFKGPAVKRSVLSEGAFFQILTIENLEQRFICVALNESLVTLLA